VPAASGINAATDRLVRHSSVVTIALFLASLALTLPLLDAQSIWFDEAVTISNAQLPFDLARYLRADATPPLYPFLVHHWMGVFGATIESARALSALASALATVLLFQLGRRFVGATAGLFAAALFLCSRFQLFFAHEARPYALVVLLGIASFYVLLSLLESATRTRVVLLALVDAALLYAHYVTVFLLPAQLVVALLLGRARVRSSLAVLASQALAGLLVLPLAIYVARTLWPLPMAGWLETPTWRTFPVELAKLAGSPLLLLVEIALVAGGLAWLERRRRAAASTTTMPRYAPRTAGALAAWAFVPLATAFVASLIEPVFLARYLLYTAPGYFLLVGYVVTCLPLRRARTTILLLALCTLSLATAWRAPIVRPAWRVAAERAHAALADGATVAVVPAHQLLPFAYHFTRDGFRDPDHLPTTLRAAGIVGLSRPSDALRVAAGGADLLLVAPDADAAALDAVASEIAAARHVLPVREELPHLVLLRVPPAREPLP